MGPLRPLCYCLQPFSTAWRACSGAGFSLNVWSSWQMSPGSGGLSCLVKMQVNPSPESSAVMTNKELLLVYTDCLFPLSIKPRGTWMPLHFHFY